MVKLKSRKKAAALKYEQGYDAPIVTAAGMGLIADKILELAKSNDVPIVEDKELIELFDNVEIGEAIPTELYDAVAKIIAFVMDSDRSVKKV